MTSLPLISKHAQKRSAHGLDWIFDQFEREPGVSLGRMFHCDVLYLDDALCLGIASGDEPWSGLLVCTCHLHQASLRGEIPDLNPHPILKKWLYVSQHSANFEHAARAVVELVLSRDTRIGVRRQARRGRSWRE